MDLAAGGDRGNGRKGKGEDDRALGKFGRLKWEDGEDAG